jgi:hypothetical protein
MEASDSYLVMERMIRAGEIPLSKLESVLDSLQQQELITAAERESLLELAWLVQTEQPSPP